jgi:predicted ATPase
MSEGLGMDATEPSAQPTGLIKSLSLTHLLSYGEGHPPVTLGSLNVLVGANGSGKSNFLEALALLQAAPNQLTRPLRDSGVREWLYKTPGRTTAPAPDAVIEAILHQPASTHGLRYRLAFNEEGGRMQVTDELLEREHPTPNDDEPDFFYRWDQGQPKLTMPHGGVRRLDRESVQFDASILAQKRDADFYPMLAWVAQRLSGIALHRDWTFGRHAAPRQPQKADAPTDRLEPDASNLGLVLNRVRLDVTARRQLLLALREVYEGIEDVDVRVTSGTVQVFLMESGGAMPATRLSDGTLRYLALLSLLCDPSPPPLIVLEEPELGLHPDMLPVVARLLRDASQRTQLVVTTHAPGLVDALSDQPDAILVCEKTDRGSTLTRLDAEQLAPWLMKYRLGELWTSGQIGGNRW